MPNPKLTKIRRRLKVFRLKLFWLKVFPVKSHATRAQNGQLITGILSTDEVYFNSLFNSHYSVQYSYRYYLPTFQQPDYKYKIPEPHGVKTLGSKQNKPTPGQHRSPTRPSNGPPPALNRPSNSRSALRHSQSLTFLPGHTFKAYGGEVAEQTKAQVGTFQIMSLTC